MADVTFEKHYRIKELVALWGYGRETIRRMVEVEPGVLRKTHGSRCTYSIPESVARRIHTRLTRGG